MFCKWHIQEEFLGKFWLEVKSVDLSCLCKCEGWEENRLHWKTYRWHMVSLGKCLRQETSPRVLTDFVDPEVNVSIVNISKLI